jgi:hypothetical protein
MNTVTSSNSNRRNNIKQVPVKELLYHNGYYIYPCEINESDVVQELLHFQIQVNNICNKYNFKIKKVSNLGRKYETENGVEIHYINFTEDKDTRRAYNNIMMNSSANNKTKKGLIDTLISNSNKKNKKQSDDMNFDYQIAIRFTNLNDVLDDDDKNDEESDIDMLIDIEKTTNPSVFNKCCYNK